VAAVAALGTLGPAVAVLALLVIGALDVYDLAPVPVRVAR